MTDLNFYEVVTESNSTTINRKRGHKALCSTCGKYKRVSVEEFRSPLLTEAEELKYVAEMRAWNCCHEGEEPLDGLPEGDDLYLRADD